jgi:putative transposase
MSVRALKRLVAGMVGGMARTGRPKAVLVLSVEERETLERWVQTCRRELLDRTLIWNQHHLLHALREFEDFYNGHRPHQGIANARPLYPLPPPITDPDEIARLNVRRHQRLGGIIHEYKHAA